MYIKVLVLYKFIHVYDIYTLISIMFYTLQKIWLHLKKRGEIQN